MEINRSATIRIAEFKDGQFAWFFEIDDAGDVDMSEPVDAAVMEVMAVLGRLFDASA